MILSLTGTACDQKTSTTGITLRLIRVKGCCSNAENPQIHIESSAVPLVVVGLVYTKLLRCISNI